MDKQVGDSAKNFKYYFLPDDLCNTRFNIGVGELKAFVHKAFGINLWII